VSAAAPHVLVVGRLSELTAAIADRFSADRPAPRVASVDATTYSGEIDTGSRSAAILEHARRAVEGNGPVDTLVLDASGGLEADLLGVDLEDAQRELLATGDAVGWCQAVGTLGMRDRGQGVVVIVGTDDAYHSERGGAIRSAAQAGVRGFVRGLGVEWAPSGVRVVGVAYSGPDGARRTRSSARRTPPIGRHPNVSEIAEAVHFIAGPDASYIVAETLRVDGGYAAYQMF
jgi:3-oxoacyl-[acyl-carrier protein] reductase